MIHVSASLLASLMWSLRREFVDVRGRGPGVRWGRRELARCQHCPYVNLALTYIRYKWLSVP